MREDDGGRWFAQGYGLALGLALGAFVSTALPVWRDAVAAACLVGEVEAGQVGDAACPTLGPAAAEAAALPPGIVAMR